MYSFFVTLSFELLVLRNLNLSVSSLLLLITIYDYHICGPLIHLGQMHRALYYRDSLLFPFIFIEIMVTVIN